MKNNVPFFKLEIDILNTIHIRYNDVSLNAIGEIIQATGHEEQRNLSTVPRLPLERFS